MSTTSRRTRKQGKKAQRARAKIYSHSNSGHWFRRIIKEMKESTRVQTAVLNGSLDHWLDEK